MPETLGPPGRPISKLRALGEALGVTIIKSPNSPANRAHRLQRVEDYLRRTLLGIHQQEFAPIPNPETPQSIGGKLGEHTSVQAAEAVLRGAVIELAEHTNSLSAQDIFRLSGLPERPIGELKSATEVVDFSRELAQLPTANHD